MIQIVYNQSQMSKTVSKYVKYSHLEILHERLIMVLGNSFVSCFKPV